ncbi:MAG TPA: ABC transporter permease [Gemmatimonadaceae bacterium]
MLSSSLRLGFRRLRHSPAFAVTAVLIVALGIGAATSVFVVLDAIVVKALPYPNADRLASAWFAFPGTSLGRGPQTLGSYYAYKRFARTIDGIAVLDRASVNFSDSAGGDQPSRLVAARVTASFFPLLGAPFVLGRAFSESEDEPNAPLVAVIGDGLWRSRFGADPTVVGRSVRIDGQRRKIVGVLASSFRFPDDQTQLWLPAALDPNAAFSGPFVHTAFVRLQRGVPIAVAEKEFNELLPRATEIFPLLVPGTDLKTFFRLGRVRAFLRPLRDDVVGPFGQVLWISFAAGVLILVIAAANVASLLLTRAESRGRDVAVCLALGGRTRDVLAQVVGEAVIVATVGGALGATLAACGVSAFRRFGPANVPRLAEVAFDARSVFAIVGLTLAVMAFCAGLPALRFHGEAIGRAMHDGARGETAGRERQRARRALVVVQVAFAVLLVTGATLLVESAQRLRRVRPGFDASSTLTLWLTLPDATYPTYSDVVRFTQRAIERISVIPGVEAVGVSSKLPLQTLGRGYGPARSDNDRSDPSALPPPEQLIAVSGGYFDAMRIPVLAGRTFDRLDRQVSREAIVDRTLAAQFWDDSSGARALGRRVQPLPNGPWYTVIGVVGAVHDTSLAAPANGIVYLPDVADVDTNRTAASRTIAFAIRARPNPLAVTHAVQSTIFDMDHTLPPFNVQVMEQVVTQSIASLTFATLVLSIAGIVALAMAAVGLAGVMALIVSLRTREIGIRLALGATPSGVARAVSMQGLVLSAVGACAGLAIFMVCSQLLQRRLNGVAAVSGPLLASVSGLLLIVALLASWLPARRAARVDPARTLSAG